MAALLPVLQGHEVEVCDLHWWPDLGREGDGGEGALLALLPRAHLCLGIQGVQQSPRQPPEVGDRGAEELSLATPAGGTASTAPAPGQGGARTPPALTQ